MGQRARWALWMAGGMAGWLLLNAGLGFTVLKRLEKKAQAPIRGTFLPHFLLPLFSVKHIELDWQGRFRVLTGTVQVQYDPWFLIPGRKLRVQIEGKDLEVGFSGELAESQGFSEAKVDRVTADFAFFEKGDPEIFLFEVQSEKLQFRLVRDAPAVKERRTKTVN